ncbi:MAG: CAP domain-containing protein, partial [Rhodobacter sp.]|nr:CAP domain-containing protein [Rhodobacter sp.]
MKSLSAVLLCASLVLTACAGTGLSTGGGAITAGDIGEIQFRALDSVNTLRGARGLQPLELNAQLNAAAATHSRDMAVQNRPWHFGSDGSSPIDRVRRVGYS